MGIAAYGPPSPAPPTLAERRHAKVHQPATADESERVSHGCFELELAGVDGIARWAAARARHHPHGRPRKGRSLGTQQARAEALGKTVMCLRANCGAMVHLNAARRAAHAAGRKFFVAGDGCASRSCTHTHAQPARFRRRQKQMAVALLDGKRALVMWPPTTAPRVAQIAAPAAVTEAIAWQAANRIDPRPHTRPHTHHCALTRSKCERACHRAT